MERTRWYKNAIIYQIYPFSYKDSNNDGMGDIKGIIEKLDYIKNLGVTAIWFSPLYDSPNKDYGYDIRDYYKIAPAFGTMDDFKELLKECHNREIKVIMDMVINHTSNEHEWFKKAISSKDSEFRDYYIIREGRKKGNKILPPNNWTSSFTGSAWERIDDTNEYYLHLFTKEQPDLNWENEKVREEIINILKFYLDMGVDGFRFDVFNMFSKKSFKNDSNLFAVQKGTKYFVDGPRMHEFLHELYTKALSLYDSYTVGESYRPNEEDALKYISEESDEFDTIFNFAHYKSDCFFGLTYLGRKFNLKKFKDGLFEPQRKYFNKGWNTLVLENHDNPRSISRFGIDVNHYWYESATFLPIITFFMWGTPYIYQGQEIGMINTPFTGLDELKDPVSFFVYNLLRKKLKFSEKKAFNFIKDKVRDHARTPMQWDSSLYSGFSEEKPWMLVNPTYPLINVETDLNDEKSVYKFYQKVIELKKTDDVLIYGDVKEYSHNNKKIIAYSRTLNNESRFILGNFSNKEVTYKLKRNLCNLKCIISNYNDDVIIKDGKIILKPYQAILFEV